MEILILPIATLLLAVLLLIVFFSKKRIKSSETKIYSIMLVVNFLFSLLAIIIFLYAKIFENDLIISIMQKIYMILMLILIIFIYIYNISLLNIKQKKKKLIEKAIIYISLIIFVFIFISPLYVINKGNIIDAYGPSYNIVIITTIIYFLLIIMSSFMLFMKNKSGFTKDVPFICLLILYILGLLVRAYYPSILLETFLFTFMLLIMYFTIENPDLKMVNELLRNKELVEDQMEDKSSFLFEMSQGIKIPAKNIIGLTKAYEKLENDIDKKDAVRMIEINANELIFKTNNILDVSSMDANKIKIVNDDYNTYSLFNEVKALTQNYIKDKNINLSVNINKNVPERLSGDDVRLKQVIMAVLINSVENTTSGFIKVKVDSITRYDVARLIIEIEDSGKGMDLDKINSILGQSRDLNLEETRKIDKLDVDLPTAIKIIKLLNGYINIKSKEKKGTIFTIVLDQRYKLKELSNVMKDVEKYSSDVFGKKRVLIVDDDKEEIFKIKNILSKYNFDVNSTMIAKECVDRVLSGELYNLIIIDDELRENSALNILKKLNEIKKFKSDVIVMLNEEKEYLKKHYLEDGFVDVVFKKDLSSEIEKIVSKYL